MYVATDPTTRPQTSLGKFDATWAIGLTLIALAALMVRAATLRQSLWLDELHTSWVVSGSLSQVAERAASGNQAPIFYWAVWSLLSVVPAHEVTLRAASWLASGAFVVFVGHVARRWSASTALGLLAALLAAGDPHCLYYGREARPYAWVALLALAHVVVFRWRLMLNTSPATHPYQRSLRVTWIALSWALFHTHYTSLLLLPAELLYLIVTLHGRRLLRRSQLRVWVADVGCVALGCAPALPILLRIGQRRDNWSQFVEPQGLTALWTLFPCNLYVGAAIVVAAWIVVWDKWHGRHGSTRRVQSFVPLLFCWYLVPVGVAWALTYWELAPLLLRRYVWVAVVPLFLHAAIWGSVAGNQCGRHLYVGLMVLLAVAFWASLPRSTWTDHSGEDWRSAREMISADDKSADWPILLRAGLIEDRQLSLVSSARFREYCTFPFRGLYSLADRPAPIVPLPSDRAEVLDATTRDIIAAAPGAWLVYRGEAEKALQVVNQWQPQLAQVGIQLDVTRVGALSGVTVIGMRGNRL